MLPRATLNVCMTQYAAIATEMPRLGMSSCVVMAKTGKGDTVNVKPVGLVSGKFVSR